MSHPKIINQLLSRVRRVLYPIPEEVVAQQVNILYTQLKATLAMNVVVIIVMTLFLATISKNYVYAYFGAALILNSIVTYLYIVYDDRNVKKLRSPIYRGNMLCIFNFLFGVLWGLYFSVGLDLTNEILVYLTVFLVISMITASITSLSYYLLGYLAFSASVIVPLATALISTQSISYVLLGCLLPAAVIAGFGHARILNKTLAESFQLRFEKEDLVKELTLQKDKENSLRKDAENASIAKSKFLAAVSHDLRQPLHALTFFTEALDINIDNPKQIRLVENIKNSVDVMESLFNALFDISKLDAGIVQANITDFSIDEFMKPIYNEFHASNRSSDIKFDYIQAASSKNTHSVAATDEILLASIVRNLVSNAFRYTRQGRVWVKYEIVENFILLEVGDTGIGIPQDQLGKIFEEYYQLTNPDRDREKGLGLGLAIVKRLVNILGLEIGVTSSLNQGSKFVIKIPQGEFLNIKTNTPPLAPALTSPNAVKVLVIDDDKMVRKSLSALLSKWGYDHRISESGSEAETLIIDEEFTPDVILADYQLKHGETGVESIMRINQLMKTEIPAVIMTDNIHPENMLEVTSSSIPILYKPVKPIQLRKFLLHCESLQNKSTETK